ncbi:DUF4349 domain-containing protein [Jiangella rhizosphaerae]|uniref:DUF4349 domain-containing protein n=1 Tax=Jiangella rhizosphaerae TaxID=2293569 RepID=A0A418KK26_9ACTN|nr:DUF4349 domain-containing protein [Jiangella rhizosphaerae]RIQ15762.1 DUF4349 domain-containing protein [Jiangella rhizosphaerae]
MTRRTAFGTTMTLLAALALAGCGGSDDSGADQTGGSAADAPAEAQAEAPGGAADQNAAPEAQEDAGDGAVARTEGGVLAEVTSAVSDRSIIYTIDLTISTDDVQAAAGRAAAAAVTAGGYVADEQVNGDHDAVLTLKIPSAGHQETVAELETLGEVTSRSRGTEDVTQEVVDIASRIESQRASIARIRALLAEATQLADVVSIESELAGREADLDALLSRQEQLAGLTSMATVTLHLYRTDEAPPPEKDDDGGFLAGLAGGWDAFLTVGGGFLTALGAVLPFAALAALIGVPAWQVAKRRRGQRAAPLPDSPVA